MIITIINNIDPDLWTVFGGLKAEDSFHGRHFLNLVVWRSWRGAN